VLSGSLSNKELELDDVRPCTVRPKTVRWSRNRRSRILRCVRAVFGNPGPPGYPLTLQVSGLVAILSRTPNRFGLDSLWPEDLSYSHAKK
jgi:hypothetical protein